MQGEIDSEESVLTTDEQGALLRNVQVVGLDVYYFSPEGEKYRLKENKQIFKDGRERKRDLGQAVSEKIKRNESPLDAIKRGIKEELGINDDLPLIKIDVHEQLISSPSYPGLRSKYFCHRFETNLEERHFNPAGYVEKEDEKTTYFIWEKVK